MSRFFSGPPDALPRRMAQLGVCVGMVAALAAILAEPAVAQPYPSRPIRVVVPFPAGSGVDVVARQVVSRTAAALGQPIVIDNRAGAGGNIGTEHVARQPADGYTLLFNATQLVGNPGLGNTRYDAIRDFAPVILVSRIPALLVVPASSPVQSVADLVALARSKPGALSYASGGNGGLGHYAGELFKTHGGNLDIVHVPYKSAAEQVMSVMQGQTQLAFPALMIALPQVKAGKLRPLAVTTVNRSPLFPDLPSTREALSPGFSLDAWYGLLAPAGTAPAIIDRLNSEVRKVLADPTVREALVSGSHEIVGSSPEAFARVIEADLKVWTELAVKLKVKAD
jgi:tripartite-type tricarboxylate transporter receptor subunit TctC